MPSKPSALTTENAEFCDAVAEFCRRQKISVRRFTSLCNGAQNHFGKTSADRVLRGVADNFLIDRIRPVVNESLTNYLADLGLTPDEIEREFQDILTTRSIERMIANRCPLSPEATRHFGLKHDPFDVDRLPTGDELFTNPALEAVVGRLKDAVLYQRFVAVIGGVGTGKTLLKLRVATELEDVGGKVKLLYPEFFDMEEVTVHGIANKILAELGQKIPQNKEARVTRIREVLTQMQQEGIGVAIVLDECHRLRDRVISSLKNFWEMTNGRNARLLGVMLFGQPAFVDSRLRDVRFKEIRQRVQIIEMPKLNGSARDYIAHRIQLAGGQIDQLFEDKALDRIIINATTPLAIGNLVNGALMHAFDQDEKHVTAGMEYFKTLSTGQQVLGIRRSA